MLVLYYIPINNTATSVDSVYILISMLIFWEIQSHVTKNYYIN